MPTKLNTLRDQAGYLVGYNGFGLQPTLDSFGGVLATSTAQTVTVPAQYEFYLAKIVVTNGIDVWADFTGATAAVPGSSITAITAELLANNVDGRVVKGGSTFSVITAASSSPHINIQFYAAPKWTN